MKKCERLLGPAMGRSAGSSFGEESMRDEARRPKQSGYTPCACRDCFDTAISSDMRKPDLCHDCEQAGCLKSHSKEFATARPHERECQRSDAYGVENEAVDEWGNAPRQPGKPTIAAAPKPPKAAQPKQGLPKPAAAPRPKPPQAPVFKSKPPKATFGGPPKGTAPSPSTAPKPRGVKGESRVDLVAALLDGALSAGEAVTLVAEAGERRTHGASFGASDYLTGAGPTGPDDATSQSLSRLQHLDQLAKLQRARKRQLAATWGEAAEQPRCTYCGSPGITHPAKDAAGQSWARCTKKGCQGRGGFVVTEAAEKKPRCLCGGSD